MEPRLGLRLVRGPNWCWGDQDGGEGCVGTVVEVGEGGRSAMVQWDLGTRAQYRCGEDDKFDLRVFDAAPTGLHFPDITCSGCYMEGVSSIHWQCAHCYNYHLCHSCYMMGRHCQEHPFFRVESKVQAARVKVSCRVGAKRVEAKGVFIGAEVVRGPHWRFGDQDGGAGKTGRVVSIEGWKTDTSRSVAKVKWSAGGPANIYRVGHKGKVDLCCASPASGGYYYLEHLAILGLSYAVTVFDEEEIVAGDFVKVELDPEVFKMMHEACDLWSDSMTKSSVGSLYCAEFLNLALLPRARILRKYAQYNVLTIMNGSSVVLSILEEQRLVVSIATGGERYIVKVCSDSMTKLKHCRVGQTVRVISDVSQLRQRQQQRHIGLRHEKIVTTAGQIGCMTETYKCGAVQVYVQGRGWTFDPLCLEPAAGETAPYTSDPKNESLSKSNMTQSDIREQIMAIGLTDEALLSGDLTTVERLVYNNETSEQKKNNLIRFYAVMEMPEALRLCLKSGIGQAEINKILHVIIARNQVEEVTVLLEEGADINSVSEQGTSPLMTAVLDDCNPKIFKSLATSPGVMIDAQDSLGRTAMEISGFFHHLSTAIILAAGANPTICAHDTTRCSIHEGASLGTLAFMEVLVVHAREHLNVTTLDGSAPLHFAARRGHTQVCSLLAAQTSVNINIQTYEKRSTPLHLAAVMSRWSVIECLVGWGAALNHCDQDGNTPLHCVVEKKSFTNPESPQIRRVREELSVASGGRAVEGYIAVACFLVREGADWLVKNKDGVSPHQALPPVMAALISEYLKELPGPESFHGSLRRELQERKLKELPLQLKLPLPVPSSMAAATASATATDNLSSKAKSDGISKASYEPGATKPELKSKLVPNTKFDKNTEAAAVKKLASSRPLAMDSQPPLDSSPSSEPTVSSPSSELPSVDSQPPPDYLTSSEPTVSSPSSELPSVDSQPQPDSSPSSEPTVSSPSSELPSVQPSGVSRQPCLLCEDYPANVRFSPCGHTVLCSRCAERAKKCLQCKAYVESKSTETC